MNRFLICSGIYGDAVALDRLDALIRDRHPDGVFFAGSVLSRSREYAPTSTTEFAYTKDEAVFVERFFSVLGRSGVFSAVVPGVFDAPLGQFLHLGMAAELTYPRLHVVHATPTIERSMAVFGLGACINGYTETSIGYYSRTLAEYYLRPLWTAPQPRTVLLLSEAPESWHGDEANRHLADALIATYRPKVCVLGDPRGRPCVERLASSLIINPGSLADRRTAWLDWNRPADDQVALLELGNRADVAERLLGETAVRSDAGQPTGPLTVGSKGGLSECSFLRTCPFQLGDRDEN